MPPRYGAGSVYRRKDSPFWWIKFHSEGRPRYESSGTRSKSEAERILRVRLGELAAGKIASHREPACSDLFALVEQDYRARGLSSLRDVETRIRKHLRPALGSTPARALNSTLLEHYTAQRRQAGAAVATINRELAVLGRGLHLGRQQGLLDRVCSVPRLREDNVRRGFLRPSDYPRLRDSLPEYLRAWFVVAYHTGARLGELLGNSTRARYRPPLRWTQVDFDAGYIVLPRTKSGRSRVLPLEGEVAEVLAWQRERVQRLFPGCEWVFPRAGEPLYNPAKEFRAAAARLSITVLDAAGNEVPLRIHDLRRSAVRNMTRAGVPSAVAKAITGHRTDSVFQRYDIVADDELAEAAKRAAAYVTKKAEE